MAFSAEEFAFVAILMEGIGAGAIFATGSSALSMCLGSIRVPNMALPYFVMMGSYMIVYLANGLNLGLFLGLGVGLLIFSPIILLLDRFVFRKFYDHPDPGTIYIVITMGVFTFVNGLFDTFISQNPVFLVTPYRNTSVRLGLIVEPTSYILYLVLEYVLLIGMLFFVRYTRYGRAFRAMAQNRNGASMMGVDLQRMSTYAFSVSMIIASLAGMIYAIGYAFDPTLGLTIMGVAFAAVFVGGAGSILGTTILGIGFGFIEAFTTLYISGLAAPFFFYGLLFVVLILKPEGVFTR